MLIQAMSATEFESRLKEGDVLCVLAQSLAQEALGTGYNLAHKKEYIRQRYIDLAQDLINKLKKRNLIIIHSNTSGDKNEANK